MPTECPRSSAHRTPAHKRRQQVSDWIASPHLPPPWAIRYNPRASLGAGRHEELPLSGWQGGVAETHRSWFLHNLCRHQGLSLSPSHVKPTVLSPNPERSAIIDLASGPYPSGANATARFTGCFRSVPALPSSDSTRLIEIGNARVLEWRGTPYSCQRLPGRADAPSYQTAH